MSRVQTGIYCMGSKGNKTRDSTLLCASELHMNDG